MTLTAEDLAAMEALVERVVERVLERKRARPAPAAPSVTAKTTSHAIAELRRVGVLPKVPRSRAGSAGGGPR